MLQKLQNRATAWSIAVLVIVLSIWLGGGASLRELRQEAGGTFYSADSDAKGIAYDLNRIAEDSRNLVTVARRHLDGGDVLVDMVERGAQELEQAVEPRDSYRAAQQLQSAVDALDQKLQSAALSDKDRSYHNKLVVNIQSAYRLIEQNRYNTDAQAFNQTLRRFPANVLGTVSNVKPLEYYSE